MSSLKEIKNRIGSVKSTLKITSAMKLVASAKLRKAQASIEAMAPYEAALSDTFSRLSSGEGPVSPGNGGKTAVVAVASNSSLCGGFNSNVARKAAEVISSCGDCVVFTLGRKIADSLRKTGLTTGDDHASLIGHPSYDEASSLAAELVERFTCGEFSKVMLVYNHFVSTSRQEVRVEQYLPLVESSNGAGEAAPEETDYIVEPDAASVAAELLPKVLSLKIYSMVLDSAAAEHAARTVAMQAATDNGNDILSELTIEYNKGRQNKITSEILDIVGGSIGN